VTLLSTADKLLSTGQTLNDQDNVNNSVPVRVGATVSDLAIGGTPVDGQLGLIRTGTAPDVAQVDLMYSTVASAAAGRPIWIQIGFVNLIHMLDQGYMGLPNNGGANDNATLGLVYVAAGSFSALNAGNVNQIGSTIEAIEFAGALFAAGLKLQARHQGFYAGNGTVAMTVQPHWFQRNTTDIPAGPPGGDSPRLGVPSDAINATNINSNARLAITGPTAAIAGGVEWRTTGWVDMVELTSSNVTKKYLYPRLFAKMPSAIANPTPAGATIDVQVAARWTT
jgi:hypothetical protein